LTPLANPVVELRRVAPLRLQRYLAAVRVRGAELLPGLRAMTRGVDGVRIYPRLEARVTMGARGEDESE
jgi:hypothetical protein